MKSVIVTTALLGALCLSPGLAAAQAHAAALPHRAQLYLVSIDPDQTQGVYGLSRIADVAALLAGSVGGGKIGHIYEHALTGFSILLSPEAAARLQHLPGVTRVEADQPVIGNLTQVSPPWGLDRIDQPALPLNQAFAAPDDGAAGTHIYLLDTGIRSSHNEFAGRLGNGRNFAANSTSSSTVDPLNTTDCNGHGTHVAGIAAGTTYGVAKAATVHPVRVLDCNKSGTVSGVISGLDWVLANVQRPAVANLSLSTSPNTTLDDAVRKTVGTGIAVVVAAGNAGADACNYSPSRVREALTLGSVTASDNRVSSSNTGSCLDLFAPGDQILSSLNSSDNASGYYTGTSMAAPHAAGVIAHHLATSPGATPAQLETLLINDAASVSIGNAGSGSPDRILQMPSGALPPDAPCTGCMSYALSGSQATYLPGSSGFSFAGGTLQGWLRAPSGMTGKVILEKYAKNRWSTVYTSNTGSLIDISYNAASATYRWNIQIVSGSDSYTFYGKPN